MLLEKNLLILVEKLRERIDVHGDTLRQSEMQTRYVLIDPLLRELGWDTENPALVRPEFKVAGKADYALLRDGKPIMMIEAKKLDEPLQDKALDQAIRYCVKEGTRYCSVTDGRRWEIYEPHRGAVPITEKRIGQFDLKDQPAAEACLKALTLWEVRVSGHVATPPESLTPNTPTTPSPDEQKWRPLSELNQQPHGTPPVAIQFLDNSVVPVKTWKSILLEVAKWLEKNKLLTEDHCPILRTTRNTIWYVVHTKAAHSNGKPFRDSTQVGSFYIASNSSAAVASAIRIIRHVGQDPAQFKVRFSPP